MSKKTDILLSEALVEKGMINRQDADTLLKETDETRMSLQNILLERRIFTESDILQVLAQKLGLQLVNLRGTSPDPDVIGRIPVKVASYYKFVPVRIEGKALVVAVAAPLDLKTQDEIRMQLGLDIVTALAPENDVADSLKGWYGLGADTLEKMVSSTSQQQGTPSPEVIEDIAKLAGDASVIKIVNQIIIDAYKKRATDIHIEPFREELSLRYRVDGLLYDAHIPEEMKNFLNAIISRIKIMSNLNIVERRLPQDGRAVVKIQNQVLDLRISTMPTPHGESIVIRILPTKMLFSLERLGLAKSDLHIFESLIQKPHGIIFVTGPTGSGKTTTLYACLTRINTKERKIITIEDPIEYEMPGITQIQVMSEIGLDFSRGLRSMLRHDPDVMMVGEVRDLETAEIAIRVALTGHLVVSTLHTNDAASGVTRLIDIGLEPYLLASSVEAFIAQRLVRVLCEHCKIEDTQIPREVRELIARDLGLASAAEVKVYKGKGCPNCNSTGFYGRTGIYEILLVDEPVKELIVKKMPSDHIKRLGLSRGMRTLRQDGWQKVLAGLTTPEEVMKVTSADNSREDDTHYTGRTGDGKLPSPAPAVEAPAPGTDRRVFKRLPAKINVHYKMVKLPGESKPSGFTAEHLTVSSDSSAGGLLFISSEPIVPGSIVEITVEIPDGDKPVVCLARVVRVDEVEADRKFKVGVYFLDLSGGQRARLNKYVEEES